MCVWGFAVDGFVDGYEDLGGEWEGLAVVCLLVRREARVVGLDWVGWIVERSMALTYHQGP